MTYAMEFTCFIKPMQSCSLSIDSDQRPLPAIAPKMEKLIIQVMSHEIGSEIPKLLCSQSAYLIEGLINYNYSQI